MQTKTHTTLSELRIGDAFVFANRYPKTSEIWRVTARADKNGRVAVNQVDGVTKKLVHRYDDLKRASVRVVFIRHTVPVAGEECLIDDLKEGDIFYRVMKVGDTDVEMVDQLHEWELVKHGHMFSDVRRLDEAAGGKAGRVAKVVFVRHKS